MGTGRWTESEELEELLSSMNTALAPIQQKILSDVDEPDEPTIFIVGAPRSGTTLLAQLLARQFEIGYITNLAARFWGAPILGCLISEAIRGDRPPETGLTSHHGSTPGYEGPHEFGFFWRRWFEYGETHQASEEALARICLDDLRCEVAGIHHVYGRPVFFKNPVLSLYTDILAEAFPRALFIDCRRDPLYVAQSLLESRRRVHGDAETWFSIRPAEYATLASQPYPDQIAGQIAAIREVIDTSLTSLDPGRFIHLDYQALCEAPGQTLACCQALVEDAGGELPARDLPLPSLSTSNQIRLEPRDIKRLEAALDRNGLL